MNKDPKTQRTAAGRTPTSRPTVGVFTSWLGEFYQLQWLGAVDAARAHEANLICFVGKELERPDNFYAQESVIFDLVSPEHVDGLVIWTTTLQSFVGRQAIEAFCQRYRPLPIVSVEQVLDGLPSLLMDNKNGMREAVSHLIEVHGHRRIAFIRGPINHPGAQERYQGYLEALAQHGLALDPTLVSTPNRSWDAEKATAVAHRLLDAQTAPIEAIVAGNDTLALGVLEALQARHIRVPDDLAVVGFDNYVAIGSAGGDTAGVEREEAVGARATTLLLTTVQPPFYQLGFRAVELLLAQLRGEDVPQVITLPTELIVRRSCGCFSEAVRQLSPTPIVPIPQPRPAGAPVAAASAAQPELIVAQLQQTMRPRPAAVAPKWAERLVMAFIGEIQGESGDGFLAVLDELLRTSVPSGEQLDLDRWWRVLFVLRQQTIPYLVTDAALARAEVVWQRVQVLMGELAERFYAYHQALVNKRDAIVRSIGQQLITTFDLDQLAGILAQELPKLGIESCYLALYEGQPARSDSQLARSGEAPAGYPTEWARAILAYESQQRFELAAGEAVFRSRHLVPGQRLQREQPYSMVLEPLYFRDQQLGFVLFEVGSREGWIYEALRGQLSSALQGALLVRQTQEQNQILSQEIRQRQLAEEELRRYRDHLQVANAELSQYAYIVSHDLQAPLRAIHKYADFLHEDLALSLTGDQQVYLNGLVRAVGEAKELVRDLLELSRIGHEHAAIELIDLGVFLRTLVISLALSEEVEIVWAEKWPILETKPTLLRQIFQNLIFNAVKFNRASPKRIELGWRPIEPDQIELYVRDNGIGIEAHYHEQIFRVFQRLHTRQEYEGTGIGLAIVRKAASILQGTVRVESTPGEGSTFVVTLPRWSDVARGGEEATGERLSATP